MFLVVKLFYLASLLAEYLIIAC